VTDNSKCHFINSTFISTSLILLFILFIRVTRCLDLTDEMQYYGQIKGLIESGKLFSNDLFIQQSVYILFYPVFYLYHLAFGFEGFVFFSRLLMASMTIVVFLFSYVKFLQFKFSSAVASVTALSLTFAIPYHGIFAPSYNTISQILWIIFTLNFFEWKQCNVILWGIVPIIMAFVHPTSAVMMSLLVFGRLLAERDFRHFVKLLLVFIVGALIVTPVVLYFGTPQAYVASLRFSSGYEVGSAFLSSKWQPITLLAIYAMFGASFLFWKRFQRLNFALIASLSITAVIILSVAGFAWGGSSRRILVLFVYLLSSLSAFACTWSLSNTSESNIELRQRINWLVIALLAYITTLGVTSGNAIAQTFGALMVGLPLFLAIAVSSGASEKISGYMFLRNICVLLVFALFVIHWTLTPYREDGWWKVKNSIQSVPEFRFVSTSLERIAFIQRMQDALGPVTRGKRTLIVSEYPGLYFVLGAKPETCMFYMHSLTSDKSEEVLLSCMNEKKPEIVVDISANNDVFIKNVRLKNIMHNLYFQGVFNCTDEIIDFDSTTKNNPKQMKYSVCN